MTTSPIKIAGWNRASAISGAILWLLLPLPLPEVIDLPVESSGETWLRCGTGSVSDLSFDNTAACRDSGRSRSPYRTPPE